MGKLEANKKSWETPVMLVPYNRDASCMFTFMWNSLLNNITGKAVFLSFQRWGWMGKWAAFKASYQCCYFIQKIKLLISYFWSELQTSAPTQLQLYNHQKKNFQKNIISKALSRAEEIIYFFKNCKQRNHRTVVVDVLDACMGEILMCPFQWLCVIYEFGLNELESIVGYICSSSKAYQKNIMSLPQPSPFTPCVLPIVHYPLGCAHAVVRWSASLRGHSGVLHCFSCSLCSKVKKSNCSSVTEWGVGGQKMFFCRRDPLKRMDPLKTKMFLEGRYFCCIFRALHVKTLKSVDYCHNLESKHNETCSWLYHGLHFFKWSFKWFEETH